MAARRVSGVIWWRMGISHYKALFRRSRGSEPDAGFTKDLLQASGISPVLNEMFANRELPYEFTYRWGAGSGQSGRIYRASDYEAHDRVEVGQFLGGVPPAPWRIDDPRRNPEITLPGDPDASIPDAAVAQWKNGIEPLRPWLLLVQLDDDQEELQVRAYLERPSAGLEEASFERLPEALRGLMTARSAIGAGAAASALPRLWFDPLDFRDPWRTASADGDPAAAEGPGAPAPGAAAALVGTAYRSGDEEIRSSAPEPFDVDPDQRDRGTRAHHETQNALARLVHERESTPRSPSGEPNFDLAWREPDGRLVVVEVKSVTDGNVEKQLRLGLGQVLRYRSLLAANGDQVSAVLALSAQPHDPRWTGLCEEVGVGLIWRPDLGEMLDAWLR